MITTLLFFDISSGEIMIILVMAFLVFGPSKFPELARKIGKGINEVKRASESIKREINQEVKKIENSTQLEENKSEPLAEKQATVKAPKEKKSYTEDTHPEPESK